MDFRLRVPERGIRREIRARTGFVEARLRRQADSAELKDLIDFMHGEPAALYSCVHCGLVYRAEDRTTATDSYEQDPNDRDLMRQLLPVYRDAFRQKSAYRDLLPHGARVLEVGSHLGAFLHVAQEWNWHTEALDVGADTAAFAREQGFRVHREILEHAPFPDGAFEAIFIWNCFEQLSDPRSALRAAHRLLKSRGVLVVRVPNAWFYTVSREPQVLAYNNLLGFPYLYGYTGDTLARLLGRCGFEPLVGFNSELITMPFAEPGPRINREQKSVSRKVERWTRAVSMSSGALTGPWIEVAALRTERPTGRAIEVDPRFLPRAA
jgi:SAM-dependent methyltransferase